MILILFSHCLIEVIGQEQKWDKERNLHMI